MKKQVRYIVALVILLVVVGVIGTMTSIFAEEDSGKCTCRYNGDYGIWNGDECVISNCWVNLP